MMGVAQEWQLVVTGIVVLIAVFVDNVRRRRAADGLNSEPEIFPHN